MSEPCRPEWRFTADDGPVPWPCGGGARLCLTHGPRGVVEIGLVVTDGRAVLDRDGQLLVDGPIPDHAWLGVGGDGCGAEGHLAVIRDREAAFGWHRYTAEGIGSATLLATGPGASDPTPGLVLGLGMVLLGAVLARIPARWGW